MSRDGATFAPTQKAIDAVLGIVVDIVREAGPSGAPAGPMYMAFMTAGWSLESFSAMMDELVRSGRLIKSGHVYRVPQ